MYSVQETAAFLPQDQVTETEQIKQEAVANQEVRSSIEPTTNLSRCLNKAGCIAALLNHRQVDISHVVVALALDQCGRKSLQKYIDPDKAHAGSLNAVVRIPPTCPGLPQEKIGKSHNLLKVLEDATKIVMERVEHQEISIEDFTQALKPTLPTTPLPPPVEDVLKTIEDRVARIETGIERLPKSDPMTASGMVLRTIEDAVSRIEITIDRKIEDAISRIKIDVAPNGVSWPFSLRRLVGVSIAVLSVGAAFLFHLSN